MEFLYALYPSMIDEILSEPPNDRSARLLKSIYVDLKMNEAEGLPMEITSRLRLIEERFPEFKEIPADINASREAFSELTMQELGKTGKDIVKEFGTIIRSDAELMHQVRNLK